MTICILGRQPALGLAELEALYGSEQVEPLGSHAALVKLDHRQIDQSRLGGTVKVARLLATLPGTQWDKIMAYCQKELPSHLGRLPEGKLKLGLSTYGIAVATQQINSGALELKKAVRATGRSVRVIPNSSTVLNSAQILHNQLTGDLGMELIFVADGQKCRLAQTVSVQDVDAYAQRDFERPKRDAFVGMLPPKLAQIMLNLGLADTESAGRRVLDPFCGTGVVLQEAGLMGCEVYGTDINERMIDYTHDNLQWLRKHKKMSNAPHLEVADATTHAWHKPIDAVISETYLGQPLSGLPSPEKLSGIINTCNQIIGKFLENLQPQLETGTRLCIAVPAWRIGPNFRHLSLVDDLKKMGYNRISFSWIRNQDLLYFRPDQIVARELLVITVI